MSKLDELKQSTLKSYVKKATADIAHQEKNYQDDLKKPQDLVKHPGKYVASRERMGAARKQIRKRIIGVMSAEKKLKENNMNTEETPTEVSEAKKPALKAYLDRLRHARKRALKKMRKGSKPFRKEEADLPISTNKVMTEEYSSALRDLIANVESDNLIDANANFISAINQKIEYSLNLAKDALAQRIYSAPESTEN